MDQIHLFFVSLFPLISIFLLSKLLILKKRTNLAPSPPSLPIIGHLHLIKPPVYRVLQHLSSKYGPIMALRFGSRPILVITSPSAAEECFTKNDIILVNRPLLITGKYLEYDHTTVGSVPYGRLWRDLRRVLTLELLSTIRLKAYMGVREDEVRLLIKGLFQDSFQDFTRVEMRSRIEGMSFNIIMRLVADKRFYGTEVEDLIEANEFKEVMRKSLEIGGASNPGDFIPFLRLIDYQGFEKKLLELHKKFDRFLQNLVEERRSKHLGSSFERGHAKTFIDAMLSLQKQEPEYYTDNIIKATILVHTHK